mgnify:CR=1 FL=1
MNFYDILEEETEGMAYSPYAAKEEGEWIEGLISIDFLNEYYGYYKSVDEMIENSIHESHTLYFRFLKEQGILK